jgi:hypothetical protein
MAFKKIFLSTISANYLTNHQTLIDYMLDRRIYILVDDFDMYFTCYELKDIEECFEEILFSMLIENDKRKRKKK